MGEAPLPVNSSFSTITPGLQLAWEKNFAEIYRPHDEETLSEFQRRVGQQRFCSSKEQVATVLGHKFTRRGIHSLIKGMSSENECWIYGGSFGHNGYGIFGIGAFGKFRAHRIAFLLWVGEFNQALQILHSCDNRKCIRPIHLFAGTAHDNTQDMMQKGRNGFKAHWKVDATTVQQMLVLRSRGLSNVEIGRELDLSHECVRSHLNGGINVLDRE